MDTVHDCLDYSLLSQTLDQYLLPDANASFLALAHGESMTDVGIHHQDLLICNRKIQYKEGDIVVAVFRNQFVCKILDIKNKSLISANDNHPPIKINKSDNIQLEAIVTSSIRFHRTPPELMINVNQ